MIPSGWESKHVSFTNDPFTPTQSRIYSKNVKAKELSNGDILIRSDYSRLILEEGVQIPILNSRTLQKRQDIKNRQNSTSDMQDEIKKKGH